MDNNMNTNGAAEPNDEIVWKDRKRTIFGLPLSFTRYRLRRDKFILSVGLFTTREDEVRLYRIMDLSLTRTLRQKIFGLGTITCITADKSCPKLIIKHIKKSAEVKEMLSNMVEAERDKKKVSTREFMHNDDADNEGFDPGDEF